MVRVHGFILAASTVASQRRREETLSSTAKRQWANKVPEALSRVNLLSLFQAQRQRIHSYTLQYPLVLIICHCLRTELSAGNNTSLSVVSVFPFAIILWLVTALPEDHEGEWVRFGSPSPKGRDGSWTTVKGSLSVSTKTVAMP